jgi:hypothetical protein
MSTVPTTDRHFEFRMGDAVVILYQGLYHGMPGRFLGLREDANWADIEERDGLVRSHPMLWLRRPEDLPDLAASRLGAE